MTGFFFLVFGVVLSVLWRRTSRLKRELEALRTQLLTRERPPEPARVVAPPVAAPPEPKPQPVPEPVSVAPPPPPPPSGPSWSERVRSALDLEQMLGSN